MSLAKQMTYFSHKGGENPWILGVKGSEGKGGVNTKSCTNVQGRKIQPGMGHWRGRWCQRGAMDTVDTANSLFLDPCNRQKTAGKQNGLVSVTQEGTLPCTPFNCELPKNPVFPQKGEQNPNILQRRKQIFCKENENESRQHLRKQIKGKNKIKSC